MRERRFGVGDLARVISGKNKGVIVSVIAVHPQPPNVYPIKNWRDYVVENAFGGPLVSDDPEQPGEFPFMHCEDWELEPLEKDDRNKITTWKECGWQPKREIEEIFA